MKAQIEGVMKAIYLREIHLVHLPPKEWNYFSLLHKVKSQVGLISLELKIDDTSVSVTYVFSFFTSVVRSVRI
jgi:hypothetical protein